jgi:hypothetical protein
MGGELKEILFIIRGKGFAHQANGCPYKTRIRFKRWPALSQYQNFHTFRPSPQVSIIARISFFSCRGHSGIGGSFFLAKTNIKCGNLHSKLPGMPTGEISHTQTLWPPTTPVNPIKCLARRVNGLHYKPTVITGEDNHMGRH